MANPVTLPGGVTVGGSWGVPQQAADDGFGGWADEWTKAYLAEGHQIGDTIQFQPGGQYGDIFPDDGKDDKDVKDRGNRGGGGGGRRPNPFLGRLKGQYAADMQKRKASSLADKKKLLLRFGSQEMARKALGTELGAEGDPFFNLISDDPNASTSTMAMINKNYQDKQRESLSALNNLNLWFSSGQGETVNELGRQKLQDVDTTTATLQDQLGGLDKAIADAETNWQQRLFDAEQSDWMSSQAYGGGAEGGMGGSTQGGWESGYGGNQPQGGYSEDDVLAAANAYGGARGYSPKNITHEGQIFYQDGQPGINIKYYDANGGTTTEWTPL